MMLGLVLFGVLQKGSTVGYPGWLTHGNRTVYEISVLASSSFGTITEGLKELDRQVPYITGLGVKIVLLDDIPNADKLSEVEDTLVQNLVNDLHRQDLRVFMRAKEVGSLESTFGKKWGIDGWVISSVPKGKTSLPVVITSSNELSGASRKELRGDYRLAERQLLQREMSSKELSTFLNPGFGRNPIFPKSLQDNFGWLNSSPQTGSGLYSLFHGNIPLIEQTLVALFVSPSTPVLKYGDEVGFAPSTGNDAMIWEKNLQNQILLTFCQNLIQLRFQRVSLSQGDFQILKLQNPEYLCAIQRDYRFEYTVVIWNSDDKAHDAVIPAGEFGGQRVTSLIDGADEGTPTLSLSVSIPAHGVVMLGNPSGS